MLYKIGAYIMHNESLGPPLNSTDPPLTHNGPYIVSFRTPLKNIFLMALFPSHST